MDKLRQWIKDPGVRGYLYRVLVAAAAVAAGYGIVTSEELALWLGLAATVLGTGTAAWFTPTRSQVVANPDARLAELEREAVAVDRHRVRKFER